MPEAYESDSTVTITLSLDEVLRRGRLVGEDSDGNLHFGGSLLDEVTSRAADLMVKQALQKEGVGQRLSALIDERLAVMVDDVMASPVRLTDRWGSATGEAKPMRDLLLDRVTDALTEWMSSKQHSRNTTAFQDYLRNAVAGIVTRDLAATLEKARKEVQATVNAEAARLVADTAAKIKAAGK